MSSLVVEICEIKEIRIHSGADLLEISVVKGWECCTKKGEYKVGDLVIYIPPDTIVPEEIIEKYNLRNYLVGKDRNRVKCIKLRGEMSYGLILPNVDNLVLGESVVEKYGFEKYEPPLRVSCGDAEKEDPLFEKFTDIENIRNFDDIFKDGEEVFVTEKIDGSAFRIGACWENDRYVIKAGSRRLQRKRPSDEDIKDNIYWFPYTDPNFKYLFEFLMLDQEEIVLKDVFKTIVVYGEVFGKVRGGHKSLHYGHPNELKYVIYGIAIDGKYLNWEGLSYLCGECGLPIVPEIGKFKFSMEKMKELSYGKSILAQKNGAEHIREGIVIYPVTERIDRKLGRVVLKMINPDYLLMKNKSEEKGEITDFTDE